MLMLMTINIYLKFPTSISLSLMLPIRSLLSTPTPLSVVQIFLHKGAAQISLPSPPSWLRLFCCTNIAEHQHHRAPPPPPSTSLSSLALHPSHTQHHQPEENQAKSTSLAQILPRSVAATQPPPLVDPTHNPRSHEPPRFRAYRC